jgi:Na+/Pi-cotransporter
LIAVVAGTGVTTLLQSSTATAMMVTSFAARGAIELIPALAIMLGANIGTALIVKALSFDVSWVSPLLLRVARRRPAARSLFRALSTSEEKGSKSYATVLFQQGKNSLRL